MGFTLHDSDTDYGYSAGGYTATVDVAAGDLIVVYWHGENGVDPDSVSDEDGNSYTILDLVEDANGGASLRMAYCLAAGGANETLTVTPTWLTGSATKSVAVLVFRPDSGDTVAYDSGATKSGGWEAEPWETGTFSTTGDDEVCIAGFATGQVPTWEAEEIGAAAATTVHPGEKSACFYRILSATATDIFAEIETTGASGRYAARVVAFKATAAGGTTLTAEHGSLTLSGQAASLLVGRKLSGAHGALTLSGQAASLLYGRRLAAEHGSLVLSGQAASLLATRLLTAEHGALTLSGQAASLLAARKLTAEHGALTYTGQAASLLRGYLLVGAHGELVLTGQDATLDYSSAPAGYTLTAECGVLSLAGQSANLLRGYRLPAEHGTLSLSGQAASLLRGYVLSGEHGTLTITGQDAELLKGWALSGAHGSLTLSGQAATLTYSGEVVAVGAITLSFSLLKPEVTVTLLKPAPTVTLLKPDPTITLRQ